MTIVVHLKLLFSKIGRFFALWLPLLYMYQKLFHISTDLPYPLSLGHRKESTERYAVLHFANHTWRSHPYSKLQTADLVHTCDITHMGTWVQRLTEAVQVHSCQSRPQRGWTSSCSCYCMACDLVKHTGAVSACISLIVRKLEWFFLSPLFLFFAVNCFSLLFSLFSLSLVFITFSPQWVESGALCLLGKLLITKYTSPSNVSLSHLKKIF